MTLIRKIKNQSSVILGSLISLMLIAFILSSGVSKRFFLFFSKKTSNQLGKVKNKVIYLEQFISLFESYKKRGYNPYDRYTYELIWGSIVYNLNLEFEFESLGLDLSDFEMVDIVQGANIDPAIKKYFKNESTKSFDKDVLIGFLNKFSNLSNEQKYNWLAIEKMVFINRKSAKLRDLFIKSVHHPFFELDIFLKNTKKRYLVNISYIPFSEMYPDMDFLSSIDSKVVDAEKKKNL